MKRTLAYKIPPDKVNMILVCDGRNEQVQLNSLKIFEVNYEYTQSLLSLRVFKCLKSFSNITGIF